MPTTLSPREAIARGDSLLVLFAARDMRDYCAYGYKIRDADMEIKKRFSGFTALEDIFGRLKLTSSHLLIDSHVVHSSILMV